MLSHTGSTAAEPGTTDTPTAVKGKAAESPTIAEPKTTGTATAAEAKAAESPTVAELKATDAPAAAEPKAVDSPTTAEPRATVSPTIESKVARVRNKRRSRGTNGAPTLTNGQQQVQIKSSSSRKRGAGAEQRKGGKAGAGKKREEEGKEAPDSDTPCKRQRTAENSGDECVSSAYCSECKQELGNPELKVFQGDSEDAVEEFIALVDPKLQAASSTLGGSYDKHPEYKLTHFSVYDENRHLTSFDTGLLENSTELLVSGFVKPITARDPSPKGGVECRQMGPIVEWWTFGHDGEVDIGITTGYAVYYLMAPSPTFAPYMDGVKVKCYMAKVVIEFLLDQQDATYEDLLNELQTADTPTGISQFSEDSLLRHAQYIVDKVQDYDEGNDEDEDEEPLIKAPCMRSLIQLAGVTLGQSSRSGVSGKHVFDWHRLALSKLVKGRRRNKLWGATSMATVTHLVRSIFDSMFQDQINSDAADKENRMRKKRRCGICEVCQLSDCGKCVSCRDMVKFGGPGRIKKGCVHRRCRNMFQKKSAATDWVDDDDGVDDDDDNDDEEKVEQYFKQLEEAASGRKELHAAQNDETVTEWIGSPVAEISGRPYYSAVKIDDQKVGCGDCVSIRPHDSTEPVYIARIQYMFQGSRGDKKLHVHWFLRGSDTILGEVSDSQEIFLTDQCDVVFAESVISRVTVTHKVPPSDWALQGGAENPDDDRVVASDDDLSFFYQKWYDPEFARFEDPPVVEEDLSAMLGPRFCLSCHRLDLMARREETSVGSVVEEGNNNLCFDNVRRNGVVYRVGDCCFLQPQAFGVPTQPQAPCETRVERKENKEDLYPEAYRKTEFVKGSNNDCPEPFRIGRIERIFCPNSTTVDVSELRIRVRKFYRPEDTHLGMEWAYKCDLNMVLWSEEETEVAFSLVEGRCRVVVACPDDPDLDSVCGQSQDVFYCTQAYVPRFKQFQALPPAALSLAAEQKVTSDLDGEHGVRKLRALDVFAGCGGLSEGLHQAGVAQCLWAIENGGPAAKAYQLNNPDAVVFTDDCNELLRKAMNGETTNDQGQKLPLKGNVELLCGGPPCQGFSRINRFNSREYSQFKNSLIASYLSYCDFFRPRFFVMENVRNFVAFKRSVVLKLTLRCLLRMGYQCTFGVLQAGSYGIAQTRRRAFILAAAPGEKLPSFPEPLHSFSLRAMQTTSIIDNRKYNCIERRGSAPLRTVTVRDAISDLPSICSGATEMEYAEDPQTHFQRRVRGRAWGGVLRDHVCREVTPLVAGRMPYIPLAPGADWRDLPNISVPLSDGTYTRKLTLIPWCLPHTGNRHSHWAGLYGRLGWDGYFSTTLTNPEPMGRQGRVIHPEQHRVISVRECARSQGFPDSFSFCGTICDKYKQVGNAVPPPLARCLGLEILRCVQWRHHQHKVERGTPTKARNSSSSSSSGGGSSGGQKTAALGAEDVPPRSGTTGSGHHHTNDDDDDDDDDDSCCVKVLELEKNSVSFDGDGNSTDDNDDDDDDDDDSVVVVEVNGMGSCAENGWDREGDGEGKKGGGRP
ncbi:DNA (cytosine-5)-methyltransferase 1-like [Babylonia areolata]|uniref:DNA (cytosine-5)-methyltransferase 1-like n=1 Tax=Babylonia areolata TaxID=304850 RepID=UPI003FD2E4D6